MNIFHEINGTAAFNAKAVNHFVAAFRSDQVVAVFNENTGTVQVFDQVEFTSFGESVRHNWREVRVTRGNDARCMFN